MAAGVVAGGSDRIFCIFSRISVEGPFGVPSLADIKEADQRSWQAMRDFFEELFGK